MVGVIENLLGEKAQTVNYCTEAPFIQDLCPTLVLGPGRLNRRISRMNFSKPALLSRPVNC